MTDIQSTPEDRRAVLGWDFNSDTTPEALAAWEAYEELPINAAWIGTGAEQDAFTAGYDARPVINPVGDNLDRIADALEDIAAFHRGIKANR
ncbi:MULTISPECIES: hypothetical protein [unclassified Cryobacterium]|uniref:hypothetical protein n=1 Tax=unclassified Cryobacterium TaxID=2649013 RepID=UPI00106A36F4|nr:MULTISPECIES: hypothetical protein [unclassified Cryobacterium]TFB96555.1 hypothetical protein E3O39_10815 [Cryobacterium sp. MDB2-A-1]TFC12839.1 hypothetical protein E3O35_07975 [Cryobacterium sp. MDB2-A-2]